MVRKLRVSLLLQPLATALFANSPFTEGKPNGFLSYRAHVWTDTDNQRSGIPPVMFEDGFGFERYAEWLVDEVPMYFVYRDGATSTSPGSRSATSWRAALHRPGRRRATVGDFADHMTTVFTDVRLKRFLEMRGADAGRPDMMVAQSAFWVGLLYDDAALAAAEALLRGRLGGCGRRCARRCRARAWRPPWRERRVCVTWRATCVAIARDGLRARAATDAAGNDESIHSRRWRRSSAAAPTQAEHWLARYHRRVAAATSDESSRRRRSESVAVSSGVLQQAVAYAIAFVNT